MIGFDLGWSGCLYFPPLNVHVMEVVVAYIQVCRVLTLPSLLALFLTDQSSNLPDGLQELINILSITWQYWFQMFP